MKAGGDALFPLLRQIFDRGTHRFLNRGKSGRWREYLREEDVRRYERISARLATPGLAAWLERGRLGSSDRRGQAD
jgi:hypothetical protein